MRQRPRYDRAPFWLWHATDGDLMDGEEVGSLRDARIVEGDRGRFHVHLEIHYTRDESAYLWAASWGEREDNPNDERVLVLRDADRNRWIKLSGCTVDGAETIPPLDLYTITSIIRPEMLDEPPVFIEL